MAENERYVIKGSDDFFLHIEDTTFTEDKHEGSIYNIYQVVHRLNEQEEIIERLKAIREEQIEVILKLKRKIKELEKCREELFIRERDTKNECRELEERNQRQYNQLKEITDLMSKRDWEALESIVEDWEESDRLLQAEWGIYGDAE